MHTMKQETCFMKYIWRNTNVLCEEMLRSFRYLLSCYMVSTGLKSLEKIRKFHQYFQKVWEKTKNELKNVFLLILVQRSL